MNRRPCNEDLIDAANKLLAMDDASGNAYRVGTWLERYGRQETDRQRARNIGCSAKYLRSIIDKESGS